MELLTLEQEKQISLDILKYVIAFCKENDIEYFAAYGTLLGTVRHQGFIPWDDDIDLVMTRENYDKFQKLTAEKPDERYRCIAFEQGTYYYPFAKVVDTHTEMISENVKQSENMGVGIDIFPLNYIGNTEEEVEQKAKQILLPKKLMRYSLYNNMGEIAAQGASLSQKGFYLLAKLMGTAFWTKKVKENDRKYRSNEPTKYIGYMGSFIENSIPKVEARVFEKGVELPFETITIHAPAAYDEYLTKLYGDYMQLPPEDKRVPHAAHAYMKEN